jgi:hypothetical protein
VVDVYSNILEIADPAKKAAIKNFIEDMAKHFKD